MGNKGGENTIGRTRESKQEILEELQELLQQFQVAVVIDFQGLNVSEISELRDRLRPTGAICKVTKNTLMCKAVEDNPQWKPITKFLKGPSACLLIKDDIAGAVKAYQAFQKQTKKTEFRVGVMQGQALNEEQLKAITELPPKEQLMAQVAGALNAITTKIAVGIKEVPSSVCRSVNEVPASLGRVVQAIATKEDN